MTEYLVRLVTSLPGDWSDEQRRALLEREAARGAELREAGTIAALWRLPGRLANVGIWRAETPAALHEAITSLPAWPWMAVEVTALAGHPLFAGRMLFV
ncbi:MAG TPA: muconolactone Delta-isomerase family protein [Jatrophihabitans sp.]|jgi:muconolactone D-isomerase|nr:muconolactone Delta-isomerase family protein [Jatrophihabitans sp.]